MMDRLLRWWIKRHFGAKCFYYERGCCVCDAWKCYDYLFEDILLFNPMTGLWIYEEEQRHG